jgi:hypothetical protein
VSPARGPAAVIPYLKPSQMQAMLTEIAARHPAEFAAAVARVDDPDTRLLTGLLGKTAE